MLFSYINILANLNSFTNNLIHFLQLYGVEPLWEAWYFSLPTLFTCLEFISKTHLKYTTFPQRTVS